MNHKLTKKARRQLKENLRKARESSDLTRPEVCRSLEANSSYVCQIEDPRLPAVPSLGALQKLSKLYGVKMARLLRNV